MAPSILAPPPFDLEILLSPATEGESRAAPNLKTLEGVWRFGLELEERRGLFAAGGWSAKGPDELDGSEGAEAGDGCDAWGCVGFGGPAKGGDWVDTA